MPAKRVEPVWLDIKVALAVHDRQLAEHGGGEGVRDPAMLDSALASMGWVISNCLIAGQKPVPMGNDNFTAAPSGAFKTGNGLLNIAANKQEQFEALAKVIGREDLIGDTRFADREDRRRHRRGLPRVGQAVSVEVDAADVRAY